MKRSGIYQIVNIVTGKRYVGSTINFGSRWREHKRALDRGDHGNIHLQRAWLKHGEDAFLFKAIELCGSQHLIDREQFYIDSLRPEFNICKIAGSTLGKLHTEEARQKMSASKRGKELSDARRAQLVALHASLVGNQFMLGKKASQETRSKMSAAHVGNKAMLGMKHSESTRRKMSIASLGRKKSAEHCANISAGQIGKKHSLETRAKISAAHKRRLDQSRQEASL